MVYCRGFGRVRRIDNDRTNNPSRGRAGLERAQLELSVISRNYACAASLEAPPSNRNDFPPPHSITSSARAGRELFLHSGDRSRPRYDRFGSKCVAKLFLQPERATDSICHSIIARSLIDVEFCRDFKILRSRVHNLNIEMSADRLKSA
jgi:hypothetical protein